MAEADESVLIGPPNPAQSYRNAEAVRGQGHRRAAPGYGFLSENAEFARAVTGAGLVWVGPPAEAILAMGDKINARNLMAAAGVPVAPGTPDPVSTVESAVASAEAIGYPVMVKAAAGGGGLGMASAADETALRTEFEKVRGFAERMFGDPSVLLERYFPSVRHIEVQILGLNDGRVVALGERECSVQRRNQKLVEESPSPASMLTIDRRFALSTAAIRGGEAAGYRNGTVECLFDPSTGGLFYFLEMNTRLQVEHPVTEAVFGVDLVEEQLRYCLRPRAHVRPELTQSRGHAIEFRVNAEDRKRFRPARGRSRRGSSRPVRGVPVDSGVGRRHHGDAALRLADGQAHRVRRQPRQVGGGGRVPDRGAQKTTCPSSPSRRQRRVPLGRLRHRDCLCFVDPYSADHDLVVTTATS